MISAVMIDSREPDWVKRLTFADSPTAVIMLEAGDLQVATSDGCILAIERKTPNDFLNTLRDERLFPQLARLAQSRLDEQAEGRLITWPYLMITGELHRDAQGKVVTDERDTGWDWGAVQGAITTVQEMGIFVVFCGGDADYEAAVIRLANRPRDNHFKVIPPRPAVVLGPGPAFLASLPGIGVERVMKVMEWAGGVPAHALIGLADMDIETPGVPMATKKRIRHMLGLKDRQTIELYANETGDITLQIFEKELEENHV